MRARSPDILPHLIELQRTVMPLAGAEYAALRTLGKRARGDSTPPDQ